MERHRFDALTRRLATGTTRRGVLGLATMMATTPFVADAKKRKKKKCKGGTVKCGKACVNTATDSQNCGSCGNRCGSGVACVGGACQPPATDGCPSGQIRCSDGRCIPGGATACCSQAECGAIGDYNDLVCQNNVCVCDRSGEGICQRYPDGRGTCHPCCPGGSNQCVRDEVCSYVESPAGNYGQCACPSGSERCEYNHPSGTCVFDRMNNDRKCGVFCEDCTRLNSKAICCGGTCTMGCSPGTNCNYAGTPCGPDCEPCGAGSICCNNGLNTASSCIPDLYNGTCYSL